jgi:hemolysin activation/secretion protein
MSPINRFILLSLIPLSLTASANKPVPPAGVVDRQIELEYDAKEVDAHKQIPLLEVDIPEKTFDMGDESTLISSVKFKGNTVISSRTLRNSVKEFMGEELSMKDIYAMCQAVQATYAERGYFLARAFVPAQEVKDETVTIEVIEGKLGRVSVIGNEHYSESFIARHFAKYQGKPINYDQILRALLLLDENSDLDVGAVFKKGTKFGTADLIVRVTDNRPLHFMIDHNNYGSDHTSHHRTGTRFDWGNLLLDGDMLTITEVVGSPLTSLNFTSALYHVPIYTYGSSMDFSYLFANFKTDKVDHIKYTGRSHIATARFNQALQRTRRLNTDIFTTFDYKQIQNFGNGIESSYDKLRVLTGGGQIDYIDGWKGRNLFLISGGWGIPKLMGGNGVNSKSSSRVHGGGRFVKLNGGWKRLQKLPFECFLLINAQMQYAFDKLPLPEQIYIGGIDNVRGYQLAAGIGDHGLYGTIELRVPPPFLRAHKIPWTDTTWGEFLQFVGFIDHGQTFGFGQDILREIGWKEGKKKKKRVHFDRAILTAAGAGVRLYGPWKIEWSLDVGYPLTDKHRSSETIVYFRVAWKIL